MNHHAANAFWAEMSPCEHFVHIYENDAQFVDTLVGFIRDGIVHDEACVILATSPHQKEISARLAASGIDVDAAIENEQLFLLDAQETLSRFLINGWPDDRLFTAVITDLLKRARGRGRKVRAFGEMVALLWGEGKREATIRLEQLWTTLCNRESLPLFCAYPKLGFTENAEHSILRVCAAHSKVIAAA